jgi:hypothetical protein
MKRMLLLMVMAIVLNIVAKGQQGNIYVENQLGCDVGINVVAVCEDGCTTFSAFTIYNVPAGNSSTTPFFNVSTYPWSAGGGTPPTCSNWKWWFSEIVFPNNCGTSAVSYMNVGDCSISCPPPPGSTFGCGITGVTNCNNSCKIGGTLQASWTVKPNGDILIIIY